MTHDLQLESRVGADGVLSLSVPLGASDANTDVIVTIRSKLPEQKKPAWPTGYFDKTYGSLASDPLTIPDDPAPLPETLE